MRDWGLTLFWIRTLKTWWCTKMLVPNSTQSVAAAVPRSPELIRALDDSAAVEARRKTLHAEIAALSRQRNNLLQTVADTAAIDARLLAIGSKLCDVEKLKLAATRDIHQHQPNYAEAVRTALSSHRRAAAARVVASIAELVKAAAELDETAKVIQQAGGRPPRRLPPIPLIDGIKKIAHTIERET